MKRKNISLIILFLALIIFLYPYPSTGFLYRNAEVLKGKVSNLKGSSFAVFLDPSFYYKFSIAPSDLRYAVSKLSLSESMNRQYDLNMMKNHGPLFWNFWWWHPGEEPSSRLYTGNRNGNDFYLLYDRYSSVAYLYIQNT